MTVDQLAAAAKKELIDDILPFWEKYGRDLESGGFYGVLGNDNVGDAAEPRSAVMTSRHLWAYSAAAVNLENPGYLGMADYAYRALMKDFIDPVSGGVFWSVRADGKPDVSKKQIYGEAFAVYALSAYAVALQEVRNDRSGANASLAAALGIYDLLEAHARDRTAGGYAEARARDWKSTADLKLSDKDIDCAKSMNTNIHVLEALTSLHRALRTVRRLDTGTPAEPVSLARVGESLSSLVATVSEKVLGRDYHLGLYFTDDWSEIGDIVSYGHDIETSWLLWEAAGELGDPVLEAKLRPTVIRIAEVALAEGFDAAAGAMENEFRDGTRDRTRVWWCQAESLVGFFNAWQLTGDRKFLDAATREWDWILTRQKDHRNGDWFASVAPDGKPDLREPKGGNWKTSYHNARCCMEIMNRVRE